MYEKEEQTYDVNERAQEKERSREQDRKDLETGAKTQEQLRRENGVFVFPNAVIDLDGAESLY